MQYLVQLKDTYDDGDSGVVYLGPGSTSAGILSDKTLMVTYSEENLQWL